jgi:hypothetical protein
VPAQVTIFSASRAAVTRLRRTSNAARCAPSRSQQQTMPAAYEAQRPGATVPTPSSTQTWASTRRTPSTNSTVAGGWRPGWVGTGAHCSSGTSTSVTTSAVDTPRSASTLPP